MAERPEGMAMTALENDLRALGTAIDYPAVSAGFAAGVVTRLEEAPPAMPPWWRRLLGTGTGEDRPTRTRTLQRALVLAVILLLVIAAIATALGIGVPGIRIFLGSTSTASPAGSTPSSSPSASARPAASLPAGASLGLGTLTPLEEVEASVGFKPRLPAGIGRPAAAYVRDRRLMLVWPQSSELPQLLAPGVGLIVTEFDGRVESGYYSKVANMGTIVEAVSVGGHRGYWLTGEAHQLWYVDEDGTQINEPPRLVGQALIWADDALTYRLETSLSRDEAIRLAESMR